MTTNCKFYDYLREIYLSPSKSNIDKVKTFRSVLEACADELESSKKFEKKKFTPLKTKIEEFFKQHKYPKPITDQIDATLTLLNIYSHDIDPTTEKRNYLGHNSLSNEELRSIYANTIGIVFILTDAEIDDNTKALLKPQDELEGLTDEQKDIVVDKSQIIYVNAGPGTGKTFLLIRKIAQYINKSTSEEKIAAISYTNTAAKELRTKFYSTYSIGHFEKLYQFTSGTIHSFCFRSLAKYYTDVCKESFKYIIIDDTELNELSEEIFAILEGKYTLDIIKQCIDKKNNIIVPKEVVSEITTVLEYIKKEYCIVTVDEILTLFIEHLKDNQFAAWIKNEITIVMIDEAQDLDCKNYEILERLLENNPNLKLFLVGDPRQNIFKFRGGSYTHLNNFLRKHNGKVSRKNLSISFRNPQKVLEFTNTFTFSDCENVQLKSTKEQDSYLVVKPYMDTTREDDAIVNLIQKINDFKNTAILTKSVRNLDYIVKELNYLQIPFKVFGGNLTLQEHIRIIQHLLRIIDSENSYSIRYICNKFNISINKEKRDKWTDVFYNTQVGEILQSIRHKVNIELYNVSDCLKNLEFLLETYILDYELKEEAIDNLNKLIKIADGYNTIEEFLLSFAIDKEKYYEFYKRDIDLTCEYPNEENYVTLSTIHSAKGLEWDYVIIPRMCDGFFPSFKCNEGTLEQVKEKYNDELKKLFVAVTRTKKNLYLTYPTKYKGYDKIKSRFIKNIPN